MQPITKLFPWVSLVMAIILAALPATPGMAQAGGTLAGFGNNDYGQIDVPAGTFKAIAAGTVHSLAISEDGTLVAWGNNRDGQIDVPAGKFKAIAASPYDVFWSVGIREDGTLAAWGDNNFGQLNVPTGTFKAVAAGGYHGLAIRDGGPDDGTLVGWGRMGDGVLDLPTGTFTAVAAGPFSSVALRTDGTLAGWGSYGNDDLGDLRIPPTGTFKAISAGAQSLGIRDGGPLDGTLAAWGTTFSEVPPGTFTAISAGGYHSIGIKTDGTIAAWGNGLAFNPIPTGTFTAIAAGGSHNLGIREVVGDTTAPVVTPPANVATEATSAAGATVTYPNATATDNILVTSGPTCTPASGSTFALGTTTVTCTASDAAGNMGAATFTVTVIDPTAPVIAPTVTGAFGNANWYTSDVTVSWTVTDAQSAITSTSGCTTSTVTSDTAGTTLTCTATSGGGTASQNVTVKRDAIAPTVACSVTPDRIWPPNHRMVNVNATVSVTDETSGSAGFTLASVVSNEPDNGLGDGDTPNDIQGFVVGTPDTSGQLRAERSGTGGGRVYTLTYTGVDQAGNNASCSATVSVPRDLGR